jgi:hypothetical protein
MVWRIFYVVQGIIWADMLVDAIVGKIAEILHLREQSENQGECRRLILFENSRKGVVVKLTKKQAARS